jgi:hypothetical protein
VIDQIRAGDGGGKAGRDPLRGTSALPVSDNRILASSTSIASARPLFVDHAQQPVEQIRPASLGGLTQFGCNPRLVHAVDVDQVARS